MLFHFFRTFENVIFIFFSYGGKLDLCQDFAFWHHVKETLNVCIDDASSELYPIARKCVAHNGQMSEIINVCGKSDEGGVITDLEICPNSTTQSDCNKTDDFFCSESKSCIKKKQLCDGIVHCLYGEDERFEHCTFPESATLNCTERGRTSKYNIEIKATPCNGQTECKDGKDEECEKNNLYIYIPMFCAFVVIAIFFFSLDYSIKRQQHDVVITNTSDEPISDEAIRCRQNLKGNQLAKLKVCNYYITLTVLLILYMSKCSK